MKPESNNPWARAAALAAQTPASRNRLVDFLRAASILVVVAAHWLMAAPYMEDGSPRITHLLAIAPWTTWLTWLLQVMPVFFFVGGYANGTSWASARRSGRSYAEWLDSRMRRLLGPVLPLVFVWAAMAAVAHGRGVHPEMIRIGSSIALIPTWFLAVYILVVALVPVSYLAWERLGYGSIALLLVAAAATDALFFAGWPPVGWINYLFVWLAVHQAGYAWRSGRLAGPARGIMIGAAGLMLLFLLTSAGPYPRSLVGVPGEELSNTQPPKLPLLALAALQTGIIVALERPARRWLEGRAVWTATVLVNSMIMTIYLWHSTVMILLIGLAFWAGGTGLATEPGEPAWWASRVAWLLAYALVSIPLILLMARFERQESRAGRAAPPAWRLIGGATLTCAGLAMLAMEGAAGSSLLGLRIVPLFLPLAGSALAGVSLLPARR